MKYKLIKQRRYCCVPAVLSMILDRRKIKHGTQENIGCELGLIVPKEKAHLFKKARTGKKPPAGYGVQISKNDCSINDYFIRHNIPLEEKFYPLEKIKNIKNFITENLKNDNDIIVCFNNKLLFGVGDCGHVSLIENINNEIITLNNPTRKKLNKKVKLQKLIKAIKYHGEKNRGGFWIIYAK